MKNKLLKAGIVLFGAACLLTASTVSAACHSNCPEPKCQDNMCCPEPCREPCYDPCCEPCWDPCCDWCGDFEIGAEALYWQPIHCQWDFTTQSTGGTGLVDVESIKNQYDWGFRVFGAWHCDDMYVALSYLYLRADDCKGVSTAFDNADGFFQVDGQAAFKVEARNRYHYQNVNFRLGFIDCDPCKDFQMEGYGLVRWVDLQNKRELRALRSSGAAGFAELVRFRETAEFWGVGLGLGGGAHYNLCGGLGLFGESAVMAIIGERKTPNLRTFSPSTITGDVDLSSWNYSSETCVVPGLDFRVGLDYEWCCSCFTITGAIGYELNYYWNPMIIADLGPGETFPRAAGDGSTNASTLGRTCQDLGFGGLFLGLAVGF